MIIGLTLAAILLLLNLPGRVSMGVKSALREALAPMQEALSGIGFRIQDAGSTLRGFGGLVGENRRLTAELVRLREEVRRLESLQEDNDRLRSVLGFARSSPMRWLPAEVIARDAGGWWQTVRLNRGLRDGVTPESAVMTVDGLAGRARDVSANTVDVLLISDPNCRVSVRLPRTGAFGVLSGTGVKWDGQAHCRLELINRHLALQPGDEVMTSGLGGVYPPGLPVGYIETVSMEKSGLTQTATVVPHADLGRMRIAFVVLDSAGPPVLGESRP